MLFSPLGMDLEVVSRYFIYSVYILILEVLSSDFRAVDGNLAFTSNQDRSSCYFIWISWLLGVALHLSKE